MTEADKQDKRRILIQLGRKGTYQVLEGGWNMNTTIYTGSLENAKHIKDAYLATGEYVDETIDITCR